MTDNSTHEIRSPAIGQRIVGLRYDGEAGYVVIELEDGDELWVSADAEGYHVSPIVCTDKRGIAYSPR